MVTFIQFNNRKEWRLNGKLHRKDGPSLEYTDGSKLWYLHGVIHRDDAPAVEYSNSSFWYQNGLLHRLDGPAIDYIEDTKEWYQNGKQHRIDGPAVECWDGIKVWYLNNKCLSVEEIKEHQINRLQSISMVLSPLDLPPYIVLWILEWSESAYINQLNVRSVVKMLEGLRNSRNAIKGF